jgi:glycosyltransferase involved in cell wall biosynthesis
MRRLEFLEQIVLPFGAMRKVLLITYMFPPSGGVGVQRALAYARYLPEHGCKLTVIAARHSAMPVSDPSLLAAVPESVGVVRAFNPEPPYAVREKVWKHLAPPHRASGSVRAGSRGLLGGVKAGLRSAFQNMLFPDAQAIWVPFAVRAAIREVKQGADTVILNVPPFSTLKVGIELKRRFPALKVIADFRDDWMGYYIQQFDSPDERKLEKSRGLERAAVESSDIVSMATRTWAEDMRTRYPEQDPGKFIVTTNGFDPEQFRTFTPVCRDDGKFVISYFGTCHNNRIYSPENFLSALDGLPASIKESIETHFIGRITPEADILLHGRQVTVSKLGFVSKAEGVRLLQGADLLLLIATDPTSHAAKLFDYIATGKPILALSPPGGEIDRLIRQTGTGVCADPGDVVAIREQVLRLFECSRNKRTLFRPDLAAIGRYSWQSVMREFAERIGLCEGSEPQVRATAR